MGKGSSSVMIIQNTAGEIERERHSRRFNALEAFAIYTFVLVVLWPFAYYFGVLREDKSIEGWAQIPLILGGIYLLFVTPFVHRDSLDSWGLGNPRRLWKMVRTGTPFQRTGLPAILLGMFLLLNYVVYWRWADVVKLFGLRKVNIGGLPLAEFNQHAPQVAVVFLFGALLAAAYLLYAVRYDNFVPAFLMAIKVSLPLAGAIFAGALVTGYLQGTNPFEGLSASKYILDVLGYTFWGFIQQLLFTAYLGNRFRKAFPPSTSPTNTLEPERRLGFALLFGALGGIATGLLAVWGIGMAYPDNPVPMSTLLWFFIFTAPLWAWYGYVLALDRKRLLVSTLAASCFAFIHINSYGLVGATWLLGTILIYLSMEDRYRNLVAMGCMHGLLGSTLGQLFDKGKSGQMKIEYGVGPWNIDEPTLGVLWFPLACIAVYIALMVWSNFHLRHQPNVLSQPDSA